MFLLEICTSQRGFDLFPLLHAINMSVPCLDLTRGSQWDVIQLGSMTNTFALQVSKSLSEGRLHPVVELDIKICRPGFPSMMDVSIKIEPHYSPTLVLESGLRAQEVSTS